VDDADDKAAQPPPKERAGDTRESRLAAALRANLRRRKSARPDKPAKTPP
jgi:hypothetical protein